MTATLRQWVRYAAEVCHPKTHSGIYGWLRDWPQLKPLCEALVAAAEMGESTSEQWALADEINTLLVAIRARQAERVGQKPTTGKATDVLHKPAEIREKEEAMRALRRKVMKTKAAEPPPTLFDLPMKPEPKAKPQKPPTERQFFERSA